MPAPIYQKFQFIAYQFPTDKASSAGEPMLSGLVTEQQLAALKVAVADNDLVARFMRFMAVVDLAMRAEEVDIEDPTTLKILVLPEFYFRPEAQADSRSYSEAVKTAFVTFLETFFMDRRYENWLFILGTIIWHSDNKALLQDALGVAVNQNQPVQGFVDGITVWNTAIVAVGGVEVRTFQKTNYSKDDGIEEHYWPKAELNASFTSTDKKTIRTPLSTYFTKRETANKPNCVIAVQGAGLVGVEICRDHMVGVLRGKGYPEYLKKHKNDYCQTLIFQVLTSCGMTLLPGKIALKHEGLFALAVDGTGIEGKGAKPEDDTPPQSQIQRVMGMVEKNGFVDAMMCSRTSDLYGNTWNALNRIKKTILVPDSLKFGTPSRQQQVQGMNGGAERPQALAIYWAQEFAAEVEPLAEPQPQVNNANNNQAQQQQVQGGNHS